MANSLSRHIVFGAPRPRPKLSCNVETQGRFVETHSSAAFFCIAAAFLRTSPQNKSVTAVNNGRLRNPSVWGRYEVTSTCKPATCKPATMSA